MGNHHNYTKDFGAIINAQGIPHLNEQQFKRLINILCQHRYIAGLRAGKAALSGTDHPNRLDLDLYQAEKKLTQLTGNESAANLMKEFFALSAE